MSLRRPGTQNSSLDTLFEPSDTEETGSMLLATHTHTHTPVLCLHKSLENRDLQNHLKPRTRSDSPDFARGFLSFSICLFLWLLAAPQYPTSSLPGRDEAFLFAPRRFPTPAALCVLPLVSLYLFVGAGLFICAVLCGLAAHRDSFTAFDDAFFLLPKHGGLNACFLPSSAEGAFSVFMHCLTNIGKKIKELKWHGTENWNGKASSRAWT